MTPRFSTFATPHGFLVLHCGVVVAGPFPNLPAARAWVAGREAIPEGGPFGALLGGLCLVAAAVAFAGFAFAVAANLPAIAGGLILLCLAAFIAGR